MYIHIDNMETQKSYKQMTREERGKLLVSSTRIRKTPQGWRVTSQTNKSRDYIVSFNGHEPKCMCPDYQLRKKNVSIFTPSNFILKNKLMKNEKFKQQRE